MIGNITSVGHLGQIHGLKGEINFFADTDYTPTTDDFLFVELDGTMIPFQIESARQRSADGYLIKFYDISSGDDADILRNLEAFSEHICDDSVDDDADSDILYAEDLIGFEAKDIESGDILGKIVDFDDSTMNSLLILESGSGNRFFIPFVDAYITEIDTENKSVSVSLPDGFDIIN